MNEVPVNYEILKLAEQAELDMQAETSINLATTIGGSNG
jgi:hypothetical protein